MKKAAYKQTSLLAVLGDLNRPLRVRPTRYMGREWWAIASEDTWPGMVMDLRRLGFESVAMEDEVLVREGGSVIYDSRMEGSALPGGLRSLSIASPTIQIRRESHATEYADYVLDTMDDGLELGKRDGSS